MQKTKMILSLLLVAALTVTQLPAMASAASAGEGGEIIAFDTLPDETVNQTVALGTSLKDLNLPNTLNAAVRVAVEDTQAPDTDNEMLQDPGDPRSEEHSDPVVDAGSEDEDKQKPDEGQREPVADKPEMMEINIPIPVEWISSPDYDGEKPGAYLFTAKIAGFAVSATPPSIAVTVGESTGTVTAFEELPDNIRWQNTSTPTFPETVDGTVGGEAVQIPVAWQTEQDYDETPPKSGLYVFDAVLGEGCILAGGVEAPRITVYIPETASRFALFRMGGGGTGASPLEITTAAQLAEIAVLVNTGRLESFLLNDFNAKVYLKLMNDLELSDYGATFNSGKGWKPIGTAANPFRGQFDGNGKTISRLYINDADLINVGLFGYIDGGIVEKLGLEDVAITAKDRVGGIAGYIGGSGGMVQNCFVKGTIISDGIAGCIAGSVYSGVQNCYSAGTISCSSDSTGGYIGGIAGYASTNSTVQNCYSMSMVNGGYFVGGVVGRVSEARVQNCAALNPGITDGHWVGRVIGFVYGEPGTFTLSGNVAYAGMVGGGTEKSDDGMDGADITAAAIEADGTIGGRFTGDNGWTVQNGKLPGFDNTVDIPYYFAGGSDQNFPGEGTKESPFLIGTAEKLAKLAELVNNGATNNTYGGSSVHYKLTENINLSNYGAFWNEGKGWVPIGSEYLTSFNGNFDGNGKTITGLVIDSDLDFAGLFGFVGADAMVKNLGVVNVDIIGGGWVGGVAGIVQGTVQNCYSSGKIDGQGSFVGGVAGNARTVKNCYSTCTVKAWGSYSGGVVGGAGTVENCYAIGAVISTANWVGGVAGYLESGKVTNCAALNLSLSGNSFVGRVAGDNEDTILSNNIAFNEMTVLVQGKPKSTLDKGADKVDGAEIDATEVSDNTGNCISSLFTEENGWTYTPGALPGLFGKTVEMPAYITSKLNSFFAGGDGSQTNPYEISTAAQLAILAELVNEGNSNYNNKHYLLINDLDLFVYNAANTSFNDGKGWIPIGTAANPFKGHFDGNHKTIAGLYIADTSLDYAGLFGNINEDVVVKDLGVVDARISGEMYVGGVAGYVDGTLDNCYSTGAISGTSNCVGGVAGYVGGMLENCYSTGGISGANFFVGGVAGYVGGTLENCYSTGAISGMSVGGVAGYLPGTAVVQNCAALNSSVSGVSEVGRVVGNKFGSATLQNNYAFSGMTGGSAKTHDGLDGADISIGQIYDAAFWTTAANWDTSIWTIEKDKLPILKGFAPGAQSGAGGLYLTERDIVNADVHAGGPYTYTGSVIEPSLTVTFDGEELVIDRDYTLVATGGTSDGTSTGTVILELIGLGNFKGKQTGITYAIQPKALTAVMLADMTGTFSYDGTAQEPAITVTDEGKALVKDTDYTVTYANNTYVGTATVTITGKGNYTGVASKNFTIGKGTPGSLTWPTASAITYGAALSTSNLTGGSNTGTWAWAAGTTVPPVGTAGYEVIFTPTDTTNYDWSGLTLWQNVSLTVNKASGLTVSTQPAMSVKECVARSYEFDLDNIALNKTDAGARTYSAAEGADANSILSNVQVNGSKLTYTISNTAAVGNTATAAITISTENYENVTATLTITVIEKDTQTIGFEDSTITKTYGDDKFTQTATQKSGSGTGQITYASDNTAVATVNATTGEVTIVGAGSANITATKEADDEWYAATAVYGLTVNKKNVNITAHDKTVKAGQSQPAYTYTTTGLIFGESLATEPTVTCPTANMGTAGTYPIVPSGAAASANYTIQYQNGTLTVSPLSTACDLVGVTSPAGSTISGTSITCTVANSVSSQLVGVTVSADAAWALYSNASCTSEIINKTMTLSVGANTAYIKVTAEDGITAKIYTVMITRSAPTGGGPSGGGGGSGRGSGSGGSSSGGDTTTTTPGKTPDQPVTATAPITATAGADGSASAAVPDKAITDAIAKAQAEAEKQGKIANGVSVALNVTMPKDSTSLTATLTRNSLSSLVSAGVSQLELGGAPVSLGLDLKALQEIQKQSGDISIAISPATGLPKEVKALLGNRPVYNITISHVKDGKTVNITSLGSGTATLSIPYTPGKNEAVGYLFGVYVDVTGKAQRIPGSAYDANSGSLLIPTDHFSMYGVGYAAPSDKFTDIGNHWGKEAIDFVVGRGLLSGASEIAFAPNTAMTRGMLVTALGRLAGVDVKIYTGSSFTDVKAGSAFSPYIEWAYKKGVVKGIGNQQFAPDRAITREEIAVIFANYAKAAGYKLPVTREATAYADASSIGSVYKTAVTAMQQAGIMMGGTDNRFNPKSNATRAEVSSMLHRYIKLTNDPATAQGWVKNDAGQWLCYRDGKALTGTQTIEGVKYFFETTGVLKIGWVKDGDNWRYYSGNKDITGWWDIGSDSAKKTYYFTKDGLMVSGKWLQIDGKWYYFYADGALAKSTKVDGYEVDENGVRKTK